MMALQLSMDAQINDLLEVKYQRSRQAAAQVSTRGFSQQVTKAEKTIREALGQWRMWLRFQQPPGAALADVSDDQAFAGQVPWTLSSSTSKTAEAFKFDLHKFDQERARTVEESTFLPVDACVLLAFFEHQQRVILHHVRTCSSLSRGMAWVLGGRLAQLHSLAQAAGKAFESAGLAPVSPA
jgi:hypothetical protein